MYNERYNKHRRLATLGACNGCNDADGWRERGV
jgi:hypothetical protein